MTLRSLVALVNSGAITDNLTWGQHDVRADLPYSYDFGPVLDDLATQLGQPAGSVTLVAVQRYWNDAALMVQPATTDGRIATVRITGGTVGATDEVGLIATLSNGMTLDPVAIQIEIVDQLTGLAAPVVPPPGTGGGSTSPTEFAYVQTMPAIMWTIAHGLGIHPSVQVTTTSGDLVDGDVHYADANTVVLSFAAAFAGTAYLN